MARVIDLFPEAQGEEMVYLQNVLKDMDDERAKQFINIYRARRKEPMLVLVTALIGFVGVAGVHRFIIGHIGMGILYFFTAGLCLIGTIVDLVNHQKLAFEHNQKIANEVLIMMRP
jgi:TM2 domain-containing membrane protein YozV